MPLSYSMVSYLSSLYHLFIPNSVVLGTVEDRKNSKEYSNVLYKNQPDAYDIIVTNVLAIHSGSKSHKRVNHYLDCGQIPGTGGILLQTSDNCNSTNSALDPFSPPALVDYFI